MKVWIPRKCVTLNLHDCKVMIIKCKLVNNLHLNRQTHSYTDNIQSCFISVLDVSLRLGSTVSSSDYIHEIHACFAHYYSVAHWHHAECAQESYELETLNIRNYFYISASIPPNGIWHFSVIIIKIEKSGELRESRSN